MLAIQQFMNEHPDFNEARAALYKMGIKTTFNDDFVLFSMVHVYKKTLDNILQSECNGLILSRVDWRAVVVPPKSLQFNLNTALTNEFLQKNYYTIYPAYNGTCFNLYVGQPVSQTAHEPTSEPTSEPVSQTASQTAHEPTSEPASQTAHEPTSEPTSEPVSQTAHEPTSQPASQAEKTKWQMSTANGLNMADVVLNDGKTLAQYVNEAAGGRWAEFTDTLDPALCYSFGFSHPNYHPMTDKPALWFIQSVGTNPILAGYLQVSREWFTTLNLVQCGMPAPIEAILNIEQLYELSAKSEDAYYRTGVKNYGYILRSAVPETGLNSDLYIESRLMKKIRQCWYDSSAVQMCINRKLPKQKVIPLMNYLMGNQADFCRLFNYEDEFTKYTALTNSLVNVIQQNKANTSDDIRAIKFHSVAAYLSVKFTQSKAFKIYEIADNTGKTKILTDYLRSPQFFETYITLL